MAGDGDSSYRWLNPLSSYDEGNDDGDVGDNSGDNVDEGEADDG